MIDIEVLCRKDPTALAELIAATMRGAVVIDHEPELAHLAVLLAAEEIEQVHAKQRVQIDPELAQRQVVIPDLDRENDWSQM